MFRSEVLAHRVEKLQGNVAIAIPPSWQSVGYVVFGGVAAAGAFLSLASYARVETVTGSIVPDKGIAAIVPTRNGVILSLPAREGQHVAAGAELASIRVEEDGANGLSASAQVEAAARRQDASLAAQMNANDLAAEAQMHQFAAQRAGAAAESEQLRSQIALQHELIASAQNDYDRARTIAGRGFISQRDLQVREESLLARRQGLAQLTQSLASRQAALMEAERAAAQVAAQARAQSAGIAASRAEVAQQAASVAGTRSYGLRAPIAGRVTALTARIGQPATAQAPLMSIVPDGSVLRAELAVSSSAVGFVKQGQQVRLSIDAFPYQQFGTINGQVITVAASAVSQQTADGRTISVYPVTVALDRSDIAAYGRREPLVPGMTLAARIVTEKRSLLQWLFEPVFAMRRR